MSSACSDSSSWRFLGCENVRRGRRSWRPAAPAKESSTTATATGAGATRGRSPARACDAAGCWVVSGPGGARARGCLSPSGRCLRRNHDDGRRPGDPGHQHVHQPTSYTCIGWIINSLLSAFVHHIIYGDFPSLCK